MITQEELKGNWNSIVGAVKEKFGQITGDDLTKVEGNFEQFIGLLQRKTGQSRKQIESFLDDCCSQAGSTLSSAADVASSVASRTSHYVADGYDQLAGSAERGYDYARSTVSSRPIESVALVAGASLLAGVFLGLSLGNRR